VVAAFWSIIVSSVWELPLFHSAKVAKPLRSPTVVVRAGTLRTKFDFMTNLMTL
jgi:hypothetical protein